MPTKVKERDPADKLEDAYQKYIHSEKGKEALKRHLNSDESKEARRRYSHSEAGKAAQLRYRLSEKGKETYKRGRATVRALRECQKWLEENPGKTPQDFLAQIQPPTKPRKRKK